MSLFLGHGKTPGLRPEVFSRAVLGSDSSLFFWGEALSCQIAPSPSWQVPSQVLVKLLRRTQGCFLFLQETGAVPYDSETSCIAFWCEEPLNIYGHGDQECIYTICVLVIIHQHHFHP